MFTDMSECQCDCHTMDGCHHIMACCTQCPICQRNISIGAEEHIKQCKVEREKLLQQTGPEGVSVKG